MSFSMSLFYITIPLPYISPLYVLPYKLPLPRPYIFSLYVPPLYVLTQYVPLHIIIISPSVCPS